MIWEWIDFFLLTWNALSLVGLLLRSSWNNVTQMSSALLNTRSYRLLDQTAIYVFRWTKGIYLHSSRALFLQRRATAIFQLYYTDVIFNFWKYLARKLSWTMYDFTTSSIRSNPKEGWGTVALVTEPEDKMYRIFFKRRWLHDHSSVPFGYKYGLWSQGQNRVTAQPSVCDDDRLKNLFSFLVSGPSGLLK